MVGRLDALGFDPIANSKPGRSPTLQKTRQSVKRLRQTTPTDRVPERWTVGPYGLPNRPYYPNARPRPPAFYMAVVLEQQQESKLPNVAN
jgi:hypothetical protein